MSILYTFVLVVYVIALVYITLYCMVQLHLLFHYQRHHRAQRRQAHSAPPEQEELPFVTVQLPIYNEMYVIERLIDAVAAFDYPRERFEIHILDDSTDETVDLVRRKVDEYHQAGYQIEQIIRPNRQGFKAGALREATPHARGELIAIFDADFLPRPDFLRRTIPYFQDPEVGVVQTRWEHINQDYSLITELQALQLNVHFTVEQQGRRAGKLLLQFNGTAGIWRRNTIDDAGGWEADTLTEDLDLSIRAQLKGWQIAYLEEVGAPAELPAEMNGLKSQQFRWMKGGAETARKMLPTVWRSQLSLRQKLHTTAHLLASTIFLFVFVVGVFSVPMLFALDYLKLNPNWLTIFFIGWLSVISVYYVANVQADLRKQPYITRLLKFLVLFPLFLALSMGLALHNSIAVLQGYLGKKSAFVRTPKFNIRSVGDSFHKRAYLNSRISTTTLLEGLLASYFAWGIYQGFRMDDFSFFVFHLLLFLGYGSIFLYTLWHLNPKR